MMPTSGDNEPTPDDGDTCHRGIDIRPQVAARLCGLAWQLYQQQQLQSGVSKFHCHHHLGVSLPCSRPAGAATVSSTAAVGTWDLRDAAVQCLRCQMAPTDVRRSIPQKPHESFEQVMHSGNCSSSSGCSNGHSVCQNKSSFLPPPPPHIELSRLGVNGESGSPLSLLPLQKQYHNHNHNHYNHHPAAPSAVKLAAHWSTPCSHTRCWRRLRSKKKRLYYYCTFCGEKWRVPNGNSPWVPQATATATATAITTTMYSSGKIYPVVVVPEGCCRAGETPSEKGDAKQATYQG